MTRYVSRAAQRSEADAPNPYDPVKYQSAPLVVFEEPGRNTGLLDIRGNPLYALPDPIGFKVGS